MVMVFNFTVIGFNFGTRINLRLKRRMDRSLITTILKSKKQSLLVIILYTLTGYFVFTVLRIISLQIAYF